MPILISFFTIISLALLYFYIKGLSPRLENPLRYENNPELYRYYNTPDKWKNILDKKIPFYKKLSDEKKKIFELKIQKFFQDYSIRGYNTEIDITDKLLVASGGIIPVFEFKNWMYNDLEKIFLVADRFNDTFKTGKEDSLKDGLVINNFMYLSKKALRNDFSDEKSKCNVAIHEFAHFIDFADNEQDGFPNKLLDSKFKTEWYEFSIKAAKASKIGKNSINQYAYKNLKEFFAVMCEYYFEQPDELEKNHNEAFLILKKAFSSKMGSAYTVKNITNLKPNKNCPCRSGKRFKNCCLE